MRTRQILGIASLVTLGSCGVEFVGPLPVEQPASFSVSVEAIDDPSGAIHLTALFVPGTDEHGEPRPVADPSIEVSGDRVAPTEASEGGPRRYMWAGRFVAGSGDPVLVRVRPPEIVGAHPAVAEVIASLPHREGPETLSVGRGASIPLVIAGVPADADETTSAWTLTVEPSSHGGEGLRVAMSGVPADTFVLPADWIPAGLGDDLVVRMVAELRTRESQAGAYPVDVSVYSLSTWRVQRH